MGKSPHGCESQLLRQRELNSTCVFPEFLSGNSQVFSIIFYERDKRKHWDRDERTNPLNWKSQVTFSSQETPYGVHVMSYNILTGIAYAETNTTSGFDVEYGYGINNKGTFKILRAQ